MKPSLIHTILRTVLALAIGFHLGTWLRQSDINFWIDLSDKQHGLLEKMLVVEKDLETNSDNWKKTATNCLMQCPPHGDKKQ